MKLKQEMYGAIRINSEGSEWLDSGSIGLIIEEVNIYIKKERKKHPDVVKTFPFVRIVKLEIKITDRFSI